MAKSKLNALTEALVQVDTNTHPLFKKLWESGSVERLYLKDFESFRQTPGLALLFLVDDPVKFKETLDMTVIAPEIVKMFDGALSGAAFSDPADGRKIAAQLGIYRLPSVVVFRFGETMGSVDGLKSWSEYETELVEILTQAAPKKTIAIANA